MANLIRRRAPFNDMRHEIDRVFDSFLSDRTEEPNGAASAVWAPRVDLAESEDAYQVHVDLPGLDKEDLEINYHERTLTLSGERTMEKSEEEKNFSRIERSYGRFYRSFSLPKAADSENIEASYKNGVLDIRIPKTPESKPRRIEVS